MVLSSFCRLLCALSRSLVTVMAICRESAELCLIWPMLQLVAHKTDSPRKATLVIFMRRAHNELTEELRNTILRAAYTGPFGSFPSICPTFKPLLAVYLTR